MKFKTFHRTKLKRHLTNLQTNTQRITIIDKIISLIKKGHRKVSFFVFKFDLDFCLPILIDE
jgi:hypothetical protein